MEQSIATEQRELRASLLSEGVSEKEIESNLRGVEARARLFNRWEKSEPKDYVIESLKSIVAGIILGSVIYLFFFRKSHRKTIVAILVLLFFAPGLWRTYIVSTDTRWLISLSTMPKEDVSYGEMGFVLTPEFALTLLTKAPWLHSDCAYFSRKLDWCGFPVLHFAGNTFDGASTDMRTSSRAEEVLKWALEQGLDVNEVADGMTALHHAILYNNARYLELLIDAGADPQIKVSKPGRPYNGLNGFEYLTLLESKGRRDYTEVRALMDGQ